QLTGRTHFSARTTRCRSVLGPVYIHLVQSGDEVDDGSEAFVGLLVAHGNASKGLYAAEEVFDEMPPLEFFSVMLGISAGPLAERNDGLHVVGAQSFAQANRHQISCRRSGPSNRCRL